MSVQSFGTTRVQVLGFSKKNDILDVVLVEKHKVYYKEGSGAFSQRLRAV